MSEELREKAKAATPGKWRIDPHLACVISENGSIISGNANCEFAVAANPTAILALLDERDRLLTANEGMRKALEVIRDSNQDREWMGEDGSYGTKGWVTRDGQYAKIARAALSLALNSKLAPAGDSN